MQQKHSDKVAEEGRRDCKPMYRGILQPHRGMLGEVYQGCGDLQMPKTDVGLFRKRLAGGPPECWEGVPSMDPDRETAKERGDEPASVSNVLSSSGAGGVNLWGGYLCFVGGNFKEAGGGACGFPTQVPGQKAKWQRNRTWRSAAAAMVLKEVGTQSLGTYLDKR